MLTLALTDDEGRVVDLDAPELYPAGLVKDPSSELWWSTLTDESAKAPSRDDVRAAALEVVQLNVRDDPQLCLSFCDAKAPTDGLSPPAFGVALGMAFKPRTFGPASISASSLAETIWADEVRDSAWFPSISRFNFASMASSRPQRRDAVERGRQSVDVRDAVLRRSAAAQ